MADRSHSVTLLAVVAQAVATIALGLLGASGLTKVVDPEPTSGALSAARLPSSSNAARALGLVEVVVAVVGLAVGGLTLLVAALLYLGFAIFTLSALRRRIPIQSCGCFGRDDTPPTWTHVVYNVIASGALAWSFFLGRLPIDWALPPIELVLWIGFAAIGVFASYLLLSRLPQTLALAKAP